MKAVRIILFFWSLILPGMIAGYASAPDDDPAKLYTQGNSEYQKGNYASAERYYRQILNSGSDNGAVYYNLGNACFKQKKLGDAIYYWEKAQQQEPANEIIRENLLFANLLIVDRIETRPDPLPIRMLSALQGFFSIELESWVALALFIAANIFFALYLTLNSRNSFRALIVSFVFGALFMVFAGSLAWKIYQRDYSKQGIVVEQKVDVRSGPGQENISVFTIHEGIRVRVLGSANGWCQISLPNGWNGWLPQNYIRVL
jgi:tetratricopeptide (TPR) repeat protein